MKKSDSIIEISKALSAFQSEVEQPSKSADNPFFKSKYTPFDDIVKTVNKFAPKHGLSFTQWALTEEGKTGVATMLMHTSGEWIEYPPLFLPVDKNTAQAAGSVVTYAKRYALAAVFGIASDEDDDGNGASGTSKESTQGKPKSQSNGDSSKISESQVKLINAKLSNMAKVSGRDKGMLEDTLKGNFSISSFKDLPKSQMKNVVSMLEEWEKQAGVQ